MATFKDDNGKEWDLQLDAPKIIAVREECDERFMLDSGDENTFARLAADPVLLCRVLFVLCAEQREDRKVSEKDFYRALGGDAIDSATDALLKAIVSFTPRRQRELLEVGAAKTDKIRQVAMQRAMAKINDPALEEKLLAMVDAEVDRLLGSLTPPTPATSSPASSEFVPTI